MALLLFERFDVCVRTVACACGYPRDDESRQHMHSYEYDSDQARTMPFCMAHACMDEYSDALGLFTDQLRNSGSHLPTASELSGLCLSVTIGPVTRRLVRHQNAPPALQRQGHDACWE